MDQTSVTQNRRSRRSRVLLQGTLELPGRSLPVILRNLSQDGALVCGEELPEPGERALFHRQGLSVPSEVAWVENGCAGLAFDFPLFPKEMLRHVPTKQDNAPPMPPKKRPGLKPRPLTQGERRIIAQWGTESPFALGD